jgi:glycosyltransferase involved in cell wall biosynthesis
VSEPPAPAAVVAWAAFQPRTAAIASALDGEALFVATRLPGGPALLPVRYLAGAVRTIALLERRRPRRVVVITPPVVAPLVAWAWCRLRRSRLAVDCHTDAFHSRRWRWARPLHRWVLRRATPAIVHTEEARELVAGWGAPTLLLPDDVPAASDADPPEARPARPTVLVAGSLDENEPVAECLAMARLLPELDVHLTGDAGRLPASLARHAPPNATFTGYLPYRRFLGEMLAADVVAVFSTDPHIMNRAAFEAVGLGRPLVLSDLPGLRARFGAAASFTANRPEAMASTIAAAQAGGAELAGRSRALARDLARQHQDAISRLRDLLGAPACAPEPRVLVLTHHPYPYDNTVRRAVSELLREGMAVDLVCSLTEDASTGQDATPEGLRVYRIGINHRRRPLIRYPFEYAAFFLAALGLVSWLGLRRRYAAVQVDNLPDFLVFAAPVPRWRGARLVFNMYELTPEMVGASLQGRAGRVLVRAARLIEWAATRWSDHVIVVSQPCFEALAARGVRPERMSVVLNTTSQEVPPRSPADRPTLVTHGTIVERYGVDVIVRAMAILRSSFPDLTLRVVGAGEHVEELVRLSRTLEVDDRVTFTGSLPWSQAAREVSRATVGVVALLADGYGELMLPIKLLEYARFGVPAVTSRLPAIEAYFPPDAVGYYRPGDERELAARVEELLRDPERARRQAERAGEVVRGLAWEHVRGHYLEALGVAGRR